MILGPLVLFLGLNLPPLHAEVPKHFSKVLSQSIEKRLTAFRNLGLKGENYLIQTAFDKKADLTTRWRAMTTLGRLNARKFHSFIERGLKSPEWFVRNAALIALLNDSRDEAVAWSMRLVEDPALVVRTQAVRNLIALNGREAEVELWRELYSRRNYSGRESLWIRAHIAEALAKFAGPGRAKKFERVLLDPDRRLYKWAINGLEASTGLRLSDHSEPLEIRRQKWLARLGVDTI